MGGENNGKKMADVVNTNAPNVNPYFWENVGKIFEKIQNGSNENHKAEIGEISENLVQEAKNNGFDLEGYKHNIDVYGMRHTLKNHGNSELEEKRGQVAITRSDIEKIPDVIYNYDNVAFTGKNKVGRETITFTKKMDDGTTAYVEEIRSGNKNLTLNSMRKYKKSSHT